MLAALILAFVLVHTFISYRDARRASVLDFSAVPDGGDGLSCDARGRVAGAGTSG